MATTTEAPQVVPGSRAHSDGAGAFVPVQTRSERPSSFDPAEFGVPTGREVNWRYTPVAKLAPLFEDVAGPHGVIQVDAEAAREMARRSAREEGTLVGISSGATLEAIRQKLADLPTGARVLGFNYDTGERYLSVPDFLPE